MAASKMKSGGRTHSVLHFFLDLSVQGAATSKNSSFLWRKPVKERHRLSSFDCSSPSRYGGTPQTWDTVGYWSEDLPHYNPPLNPADFHLLTQTLCNQQFTSPEKVSENRKNTKNMFSAPSADTIA